MGDSKTDDDSWVYQLLASLMSGTGYEWSESPTRFATTGWTTANLKTYIDANLASQTGRGDKVLINIGANDLASLPVEATWKSNMTSILDSIHTWNASALVYVAKPWSRGQTVNANTYAGWINDVLATRSSFAFVGPDERVWLENGDDGATYTSDGAHYSAAGETECAAQWKTILGY